MKQCREMQLKHSLSFLACSSKVQDPIYDPISLENYQLGLAANVPKVRSFWVGIIESQVTRIQVTTIPVSWKS